MHAVLDLKSSPWQPAERLDPLKNGMKFRIAKKTTDIWFFNCSSLRSVQKVSQVT
jgi:hypothetical protein